ncbi:MAG TPA: hypothetical protein VL475_02620, partial [Planctomycetaceae bacterium]|nr:hypothetical protein [Planctomycetaceae bacterium]
FYPRRVWDVASAYARGGLFYLGMQNIRRRILSDPLHKQYTDLALTPVQTEDEETPPAPAMASATPVLLPLISTTESAGSCGSGECGSDGCSTETKHAA